MDSHETPLGEVRDVGKKCQMWQTAGVVRNGNGGGPQMIHPYQANEADEAGQGWCHKATLSLNDAFESITREPYHPVLSG